MAATEKYNRMRVKFFAVSTNGRLIYATVYGLHEFACDL